VLITRLASTKATGAVREGTFSEGFFDLVLYADGVDNKNSILKKVFIYDERESEMPITVIAEEGRIVPTDPEFPERGVTLRLTNGNIHRSSEKNYTRVDFKSYDVILANAAAQAEREKSPPSLTLEDITQMLRNPKTSATDRRVAEVEFHKRWAIAFACLVFGILGGGAGTVTNRRAVKASGLVVSLIIMVSYWVLYISGESMAQKGIVPAWLAMWTANAIFLGVGIHQVRKNWG
jgi:lipopolysaccharide export system permease protein